MRTAILVLAFLLLAQRAWCDTYTYTVTASDNTAYVFDGNGLTKALNPTLTASIGDTLIFNIMAGPTHIFYIKTQQGVLGSADACCATNNGVSTGNVTLTITSSTPNPIYYQCGVHPPMGGMITLTSSEGSTGIAGSTGTASGSTGSGCLMNIVESCQANFSNYSEAVLLTWTQVFPDAAVLVSSSENNPSVTITHTMVNSSILFPSMGKPMINGISWKTPLVNNALFSYECSSEGVWGNFYEIMLAEVPGVGGSLSATEAYTHFLHLNGIFVQGDHYHWKGMVPCMYAIHSSNMGMDPVLFSMITVDALFEYAVVATLNLNATC